MPVSTIRDLDAFVTDSDTSRDSWVQVAPAMERPVTSPAFTLGEWPAELSYAYFNETRVGAIRCYRIRNVQLTFDGVMMTRDAVLASVVINHPDYHVAAVLGRLSANPDLPIRRVDGQVVMLSGPGIHIYGHWLIDILPRLFVLITCGHDLTRLRYAVPSNLPAFCHVYLGLLGIGRDQLVEYDESSEVLEVEELIVPTNLRFGSQIHPLMRQAASFFRKQLLPPTAGVVTGRRLFISRRQGEPSRTMTNREKIESVAQEAGYELATPETLSIPEQVCLFASASEIVGEYGSGLHGSIFAPHRTVVMALRGSSHHPGFIQSGLGQVFGHPTGYVLSPTPIDAVDQHFTVSEDAFRLGLRCTALQAAAAASR